MRRDGQHEPLRKMTAFTVSFSNWFGYLSRNRWEEVKGTCAHSTILFIYNQAALRVKHFLAQCLHTHQTHTLYFGKERTEQFSSRESSWRCSWPGWLGFWENWSIRRCPRTTGNIQDEATPTPDVVGSSCGCDVFNAHLRGKRMEICSTF